MRFEVHGAQAGGDGRGGARLGAYRKNMDGDRQNYRLGLGILEAALVCCGEYEEE